MISERCVIRTLAFALFLIAASPALAQEAYRPPRTPDDHPDFQGVWTNSSITLLERTNPALPLVLDAQQTKQLEIGRAQENAADAAPSSTTEAPKAGIAIVAGNLFWLDRGSGVAVVNGQSRSSWITDPPNGKLPVSDQGRKRINAILARRGEEGPEGMNPADRCLIGSRGSGGPPMLNNLYNNNYEIVQTADEVVILVEMMHDARIIRMGQPHRPAAVSQWLGDSVGHWDGDTLVVETRGWNRGQGDYEPVFLSEKAVVTERFTRTSPAEMLYTFEVNDPGFYSQPWKGEMIFAASHGRVYEYACHEGNHALGNILKGARIVEEEAKK
jgi:hypothetical protein